MGNETEADSFECYWNQSEYPILIVYNKIKKETIKSKMKNKHNCLITKREPGLSVWTGSLI